MSVIKRKFFLVLDKNLESKEENCFNINLFYLKSFNKKTQSITYVKTPFFRGTVLFGLDFKNKFRPLSFTKILSVGNIEPVDPKVFKKFLISEKMQFIAFSNQTNPQDFRQVGKMLKSFQIKNEKIINLTFCKSCLEKKEFNILNKNQQIKTHQNQIICSDCALELVLNRAKIIGLISAGRVNPKLKNFFNHMILKFKNIDKVLNAFKTDFNPVKNREATLYDIEKSPPLNKKYINYPINDLLIPKKLITILKTQGINKLLPIQAISIERGLLSKYENQIVMAPTSSGKTLIGEIAGISKILTKSLKMLYLVPIVALANVRTEEFEKKYKDLNLKIIKKIGESLLDKTETLNLEELIDANIIIATYEAIDFLLRGGNKELLGDIGTIVIDEIQTLTDLDRGYLLDGLIARLKVNYGNVQFLYLSATIGAPEILAKKLDGKLIKYNNRPVPVERHLVLCLNESLKHKFIIKLIRSAFSEKSSYGFRGQSIVFTNSRKKCESLATFLNKRDITTRAYHSGLTSEERKIIEMDFQNQKISAVVATAALAAGVDFPAKQVIFESLAMGIKILTVAEFEQMLGRAGRLGKHDVGYAYLLVEPEKIYVPKMKLTEENIAIKLLNGKIKDFELEPVEDKSMTELLGFISMFNKGTTKERIYEFNKYLINSDYEIELLLKKLITLKLILLTEDSNYIATQLGRAVSKSFLTIEKSLEIIELLRLKAENIINIVLELKPLKNVYLSKKVVSDLSKNINMKYFSNNFFSSSVLSLMNADYVRKRKKFSNEFIEFIVKWVNEIFNCDCKDNPYCDCGRKNLERMLLSFRINKNLSVDEISKVFEEEYKIQIFKGDIIDYLENLIYSFESILNILNGIPKLDLIYEDQIKEIPNIIEKIRNPLSI
ncbi:MAG: DEAD/DEAH box helicase [Promethearchaeota archaeon]